MENFDANGKDLTECCDQHVHISDEDLSHSDYDSPMGAFEAALKLGAKRGFYATKEGDLEVDYYFFFCNRKKLDKLVDAAPPQSEED